jgi:hypothetical protein
MTAPGPVSGANPWTLSYQSRQYDTSVPPRRSVLDSLVTPPASGITAEVSPAKVFAENTNPPVGAGGNEPVGVIQ